MKILIIDDKKKMGLDGSSEQSMIDVWRNKIPKGYNEFFDITHDASDYFKWDPAGNDCALKFAISYYDYVFLHHSQQGDSHIPSNIVDIIKDHLGDKLILFSGSIRENYLDNTAIYRGIPRDKLMSKFTEFIKISFELNRWVIEALFFDYESQLIFRIVSMIDNYSDIKYIFSSNEMKDLLKLKSVKTDSNQYKKLLETPLSELVHSLRTL